MDNPNNLDSLLAAANTDTQVFDCALLQVLNLLLLDLYQQNLNITHLIQPASSGPQFDTSASPPMLAPDVVSARMVVFLLLTEYDLRHNTSLGPMFSPAIQHFILQSSHVAVPQTPLNDLHGFPGNDSSQDFNMNDTFSNYGIRGFQSQNVSFNDFSSILSTSHLIPARAVSPNSQEASVPSDLVTASIASAESQVVWSPDTQDTSLSAANTDVGPSNHNEDLDAHALADFNITWDVREQLAVHHYSVKDQNHLIFARQQFCVDVMFAQERGTIIDDIDMVQSTQILQMPASIALDVVHLAGTNIVFELMHICALKIRAGVIHIFPLQSIVEEREMDGHSIAAYSKERASIGIHNFKFLFNDHGSGVVLKEPMMELCTRRKEMLLDGNSIFLSFTTSRVWNQSNAILSNLLYSFVTNQYTGKTFFGSDIHVSKLYYSKDYTLGNIP
ncbi:hypothetical protein SERLADRAFT_409203 [Serpula lacrymans var. lacrymans S7.9]|uniref:Uncharacterized protein n=1 Tax=Serpula lacrymans var. lacrymans (strain S7.9) TaxID=578457 RepID=F8NZJ8_SERL9|nr:uncharacterized protein SERLADRAFT_409203 [Serpula lacrymans var. lacrymans S7.9]EGO24018.1 hypothetical protein SERLADRAFT_409203 [Serpula lacrymans var. lacrymans S7.9]